jgi:tetratricopeptide (TPR) repeat protein
MRIFSTRLKAINFITVIMAFTILAGTACSAGNRNLSNFHERLERLLGRQNQITTEEPVPDPREVYVSLSEAINDYDFGEARRLLNVLNSIPDIDPMYVAYSEAYLKYRLGLYDNALVLANSLNPGIYNHKYLELRSAIFTAMGDLDSALNDLDTIMLSRREDETSRRDLLWDLLIQTGQWGEASNLENEIDSDPSPQYNDLYNILERAILNRDFATAEQIIERMPSLPDMVQGGYSDFYAPITHIVRARMYFEQGEIDRALENLWELGSEYERITTGWTNLAELALKAGRYGEAKSAAIEGIIRSGGWEVLDSLGIVYDYPGSVLTEYSPMRHEEVAYLVAVIGRMFLADGDVRGPIQYATKALEINKYTSFAYDLLSIAYEFNGDIDKSIENTVSGMELFPYDRELMLRYVRLSKMAPDSVDPTYPDPDEIYTELLGWAEGYREHFPNDPKSAFLLARVLDFASTDDAQIRQLELMGQAYADSPQIPGIAIYYACLLAANNRCDEAREIIASSDIPVDSAWSIEFTSPDILSRADEMCGFSGLITNAMSDGIE